MALIDCKFFSEVLELSCTMNVILPQETKKQIGLRGKKSIKSKSPVLYLLHGLSDDHSIWLRRTSIERYVSELGLAVVMPAVERSFYTDMAHGLKWWTFISQELPEIVTSLFSISSEREDNFVAGLSMGGYGAFKLAMSYPEKFCAAASLSGVLDIANYAKNRNDKEIRDIFGDEIAGTENDLFVLSEKLLRKKNLPLPIFFQTCGTEDFLYKDNIKFRNHALQLGLDLTYDSAKGAHNWNYWDLKIQEVLKWLTQKEKLKVSN